MPVLPGLGREPSDHLQAREEPAYRKLGYIDEDGHPSSKRSLPAGSEGRPSLFVPGEWQIPRLQRGFYSVLEESHRAHAGITYARSSVVPHANALPKTRTRPMRLSGVGAAPLAAVAGTR